MNKSLLLFLAAGILFFHSCQKKRNVSIEGSVASASGTPVMLYELLPDTSRKLDSTTIDAKGRFSFRIHLTEEGFYLLQFQQKKSIALLLAKDEKVSVEGDLGNTVNWYVIAGSPGSELFRQYAEFTSENQASVDSLGQVFMQGQNQPDFMKMRIRLDSAYYAIFNRQKKQATDFIKSHSNSLAPLMIIDKRFGQDPMFDIQTDFPLYESLDSSLNLLYRANINVINFRQRVQKQQAIERETTYRKSRIQPGDRAPEFFLKDKEGRSVSLEQLKGKRVFVYFWVSWSAPCRKMNLDLLPVYDLFKSRGLEIVAVSLDEDRQMWLDASRIDKATWIQVNPAGGLQAPISREYGITAFGENILIGRDGKVIAKNLDVQNLKTLLVNNP